SQTQSGCIPLIGIHLVRATTGKVYPCHRGKERGMGYVIDGKIPVDYAILYSRWNNAAPWLDEEGHPGRQYRYIRDVGTGLSEPQDRIFRAALRRTLGRLRAGGVRRFLVIQATPEFDVDPSSASSDPGNMAFRRMTAARSIAATWKIAEYSPRAGFARRSK